ncbi:ribosomal RNA small subunit methyltransferase A [Candidatus Kaiserbacteria bacterium CG10_big_fil_rev_8_21_14_0_10_45_20]|uniref:Ribosomal RNA small subunit methyltransferase A n=1 Tax=Candidatus Kaiserbacteria bacterium CG10_big_fil_rev_8_21_14_0_10_45_20 TaxID=1974607 RepID=A0A2H0UHD0_9BACT|nr:MAG: ribosomal RNA small subunit methyltransferase A [Candidatus Kaiserbacteria bacterium CG10_big_fil_rev_8_21_14_0_10_45_20]
MKKTTKKRRGAHLGQHLLTSTAIAKSVAEAGGAANKKNILEIGPGKGILTKQLLDLGANVTAIEKDSGMVEVLQKMFEAEIKNGQLVLIEGDARTVLASSEFEIRAPYSVAANIPYYITGELLKLFLSSNPKPEIIALLVQKEVAERIARSKKESILSLSVKAYGDPKYVKTVKAGSFNPPPSVDSAILAISNISSKNLKNAKEEGRFFKVIKAGFAQKRKTLLGNLSGFGKKEDLKEVFEKLKLPEMVRAEDVPLEKWFRLVHELNRKAGQ